VAVAATLLVGGVAFAPVAGATTTGSERRSSLLRFWLERIGNDRGGQVEQPGGGATQPAPPPDGDGGEAGEDGGEDGNAGGAPAGDCDAVTVIAARGTGEPAGTGFLLGQVSRQIDSRVDVPVTVVGLDYPAAAEFVNSPRQGVAELNRLVRAADADDCLVLLGYSQGAIVVGDALAGFSAADGAKVRAVVMFGDPRFNSVEPYNEGSFGRPSRGLNPRRAGELAAFADRIQNYCNGGDLVCQGSRNGGGDGHLAYGQFAADAATFAAGKV
jgi:cutinase